MRELFQTAAAVLAVLLCGLWALVGLVLAAVGWAMLRERLAAFRWPKVPVRIVSSEVRPVRLRDGEALYQPSVAYVFAAQGQEVYSGNIPLGGNLYHSEDLARKEVEKYPVGMIVMARRNPDDPAEAVLVGRNGFVGFSLLFLGLALMAIPLAVLHWYDYPVWPLAAILGVVGAIGLLLDRVNRRQLQRARRAGIYPAPGAGSDEDVEQLVRQGEKILAIRLYREIHGTDLKTARIQVEEMATRIQGRLQS